MEAADEQPEPLEMSSAFFTKRMEGTTTSIGGVSSVGRSAELDFPLPDVRFVRSCYRWN